MSMTCETAPTKQTQYTACGRLFDASNGLCLRAAFREALQTNDARTAHELRMAARDFGTTKRRHRTPPELAVMELKQSLSHAMDTTWTPSLHVDPGAETDATRIYADVFRCFVDALYGANPRSE